MTAQGGKGYVEVPEVPEGVCQGGAGAFLGSSRKVEGFKPSNGQGEIANQGKEILIVPIAIADQIPEEQAITIAASLITGGSWTEENTFYTRGGSPAFLRFGDMILNRQITLRTWR